eukprot:TRINITY_DN5191_c0_g1_i1.p1 TRINITY_DN5191_c0_g1~~TRINITY_DN5191_c0_g1_i1.p1  ORF type:complete len:128 (+),score=21.53 TRINITY_DN5191_c0_g1_i1:54-437(+)
MTGRSTWIDMLVMQSIVIFVWSSAMAYLLFKSLSMLDMLRVSEEVEREGLDTTEHGEKAYDMNMLYRRRSSKQPLTISNQHQRTGFDTAAKEQHHHGEVIPEEYLQREAGQPRASYAESASMVIHTC